MLLYHFHTLLTDISVIFTQSKHVIRDHRYLLGRQPISQDHLKMGYVEVFIRAAVVLIDKESVELILSFIFAFIFLPFNAARENNTFIGEEEVDVCVKRREEVLKALKDLVGLINDSKTINEVVVCLELCEQLPIINHKSLILDICKHISVINVADLVKLERLIMNIKSFDPLLQQNALEA